MDMERIHMDHQTEMESEVNQERLNLNEALKTVEQKLEETKEKQLSP